MCERWGVYLVLILFVKLQRADFSRFFLEKQNKQQTKEGKNWLSPPQKM